MTKLKNDGFSRLEAELQIEWTVAGLATKGALLLAGLASMRHLQLCMEMIAIDYDMVQENPSRCNGPFDWTKGYFIRREGRNMQVVDGTVSGRISQNMLLVMMARQAAVAASDDIDMEGRLMAVRRQAVFFRGQWGTCYTDGLWEVFSRATFCAGTEYFSQLSAACESLSPGLPECGRGVCFAEYHDACEKYLESVNEDVPPFPKDAMYTAMRASPRWFAFGSASQSRPAAWTKNGTRDEWIDIFRKSRLTVNSNQFIRDVERMGLRFRRVGDRGPIRFRWSDLRALGVDVPPELRPDKHSTGFDR